MHTFRDIDFMDRPWLQLVQITECNTSYCTTTVSCQNPEVQTLSRPSTQGNIRAAFENQYLEDLKSKNPDIAKTVWMRMKVMMTKKRFLSCQTRRWGGHFLLVNKLTGKFRNIYAFLCATDQLLILL